MFEGTENYAEDGLNLIAKTPEIAATVINHHAGWGKAKPSKPELGYMENFTHMLNIPGNYTKELQDVFRLFNILHYDHGGGKSISLCRQSCSLRPGGYVWFYSLCNVRFGRTQTWQSQSGIPGICAESLEGFGRKSTPKEVELYIRKLLENNELVYGFGHAVLRVEDPRATVMYGVANKNYAHHPLIKIANLLRSEGPKVLGENPKISDPYPNVDAISGSC